MRTRRQGENSSLWFNMKLLLPAHAYHASVLPLLISIGLARYVVYVITQLMLEGVECGEGTIE